MVRRKNKKGKQYDPFAYSTVHLELTSGVRGLSQRPSSAYSRDRKSWDEKPEEPNESVHFMEVPPLARRVIPIVTRAGGRVSIRVFGSVRYWMYRMWGLPLVLPLDLGIPLHIPSQKAFSYQKSGQRQRLISATFPSTNSQLPHKGLS